MNSVRQLRYTLAVVLLVGCGGGGGSQTTAPATSPVTASNKPSTSNSVPAKKKPGFALAPYRDKNPVLIVCSENREPFLSQVRDAQADLESRQIVVMEMFDLSQAYPQAKLYSGEALSKEAASDLHDIFSPTPTGTTVILVGTDGKIVSRQTGSVTLSSILEKLQ